MSTNLMLFPPPTLTKQSTMAAVLDRIFQDDTLPLIKRRNVRWAFRIIAKGCGCRLEAMPANPTTLVKQLDQLTAAMMDISEGAWKNALSLTRFALRHVGLIKPLAHRREAFAPEWTILMASITRKHAQIGLSRLARFCTAHAIAPDDVDDAVFAAFLIEVTEQSLIRNPKKVHRQAAVIWNEMVNTTRNWPTSTVTVPGYSKVYFIGWDRFPPSLQEDVEAHLKSLDGSDPLTALEIRPLKPGSIKTRRHQLGAYVSALVLKGEDPADLCTLADAVVAQRVKPGLTFFLDRASNQSKKQAYAIARTLLSVARHWVKADSADIDTLQRYCKVLIGRPGMALKTRARVRQFDDPQAIQKLYALPPMLVADAKRSGGKPTPADALLVQTAVAIEFLLMMPIRRHNLVALSLDEHLLRQKSGITHLFIPGDQVKNGEPIEAALPQPLVDLIQLYVKTYRPILEPDKSSPWLFPGLSRRHKSRERFAFQVSDTIKEKCGLVVNVHLFRAIAAKVYLDRHPGQYGVIKHLHGHKSLQTTISSYCGLEGKASIAHFDNFILATRNAPGLARKKRAA